MKARADDMAALKEKAKVWRQPGGRKKAYDDEASEKIAATQESQVLVPQRAAGNLNVAATGTVGMGAAITKEWLARECEARGIELPRAKKGEHAGEVPFTRDHGRDEEKDFGACGRQLGGVRHRRGRRRGRRGR